MFVVEPQLRLTATCAAIHIINGSGKSRAATPDWLAVGGSDEAAEQTAYGALDGCAARPGGGVGETPVAAKFRRSSMCLSKMSIFFEPRPLT